MLVRACCWRAWCPGGGLGLSRHSILGLTLFAVVGYAASGHAATLEAERIVVAGGDLAEIVFALDEGERVVGVDATTTYPDEATALPGIGYPRSLSPEGVLSLRPDLVMASHFAGPEAALDRLRDAGVSVMQAPRPQGEAELDVPAKIRFVGQALDREAVAERLAERFLDELEEVRQGVVAAEEPPRVLFILSADSGPMIVGGEGTAAAAVIRMAGGEPLTGGVSGYRPLAMEAVVALRPDVVLMTREHLENSGASMLLGRPDLSQTPAGRHARLIEMDGMLLLGFGPRTPLAVSELAESLRLAMAPAGDGGP